MFGRRMIQDGRYSQHSLDTGYPGDTCNPGSRNSVNASDTGNATAQL